MMAREYLSRASLADALDISESTVDQMVRRGVLPPPIRLSPGCVRWRWADVDIALTSLNDSTSAKSDYIAATDPYIRGARNVVNPEGRSGTS